MISLKLISVLVALLGTLLYYWINSNVTHFTLTTTFGRIEGLIKKSRDGRDYFSYTGIPYALPPIGERRFQPSLPFGSWNGIQDATKMRSVCPQYDTLQQKLDGHEDCLFVNVYTPVKGKPSSNEHLFPVIVFLHGGYFMHGGSNSYGANYFMDEDVVLVTLNYRLGSLGFLNTGPEARGNMGLKDQVLALKWIQATIADFGGNPKAVTIMGSSAGGASVNYHMMSRQSAGLFHRGISQSGAALCPWGLVKDTSKQGERLAKRVGCPIETTESMMNCLKELDVRKLIETQTEMGEIFHSQEALFGPSIEYREDVKDEDIFITANPLDNFKNWQLPRIPWIIGVVSEEGCIRTMPIVRNQGLLNELSQNWNEIAPKALMYEKDDTISDKIKEYYFGQHKTKFTESDYKQLTTMYSERLFFTCINDVAKFQTVEAPSYFYKMNYSNGINLFAVLPLAAKGISHNLPNYGTCHVDDLQYFFSVGIPSLEISPQRPHYDFSKDLVKLWVSFAKEGFPTKFRGVEWEKVKSSTSNLNYMVLNSNPEMIQDPDAEGIEFWKSLHL